MKYTSIQCSSQCGTYSTTLSHHPIIPSIWKLIERLLSTYSLITLADLALNKKRLRQEYDPSLPIETLFKQIDDAVNYANAGNAPYTPAQVLATTIAPYPRPSSRASFQRSCLDGFWSERPWLLWWCHPISLSAFYDDLSFVEVQVPFCAVSRLWICRPSIVDTF